jgi:hypothetical protein
LHLALSRFFSALSTHSLLILTTALAGDRNSDRAHCTGEETEAQPEAVTTRWSGRDTDTSDKDTHTTCQATFWGGSPPHPPAPRVADTPQSPDSHPRRRRLHVREALATRPQTQPLPHAAWAARTPPPQLPNLQQSPSPLPDSARNAQPQLRSAQPSALGDIRAGRGSRAASREVSLEKLRQDHCAREGCRIEGLQRGGKEPAKMPLSCPVTEGHRT